MSDVGQSEGALRVFKVGLFYPHYVVVAGSVDEALEVAKAEVGSGRVGDNCVVVELDTSKPGVIDTNGRWA